MQIKLESSWKEILGDYLESPAFQETALKAHTAYLNEKVFPPPAQVFTAFEMCPFSAVRVVILGQDPYHNPGQAMGLSFSVPSGTRVPPSLQNIYKEIESDLSHPSQCSPGGDLSLWAKQGVLLLNSVLTVHAGKPASHRDFNWQGFTDEAIKQLSEKRECLVFMLWGSYAQSKAPLINTDKHLILSAPHPSPLSAHRGFLGCRHFSQCNEYLESHHIPPIVW